MQTPKIQESASRPILPLGTKTLWGAIVAVGTPGERYYWMKDDRGTVSMMPADCVEAER